MNKTVRQLYWQALERAAFYRWCVKKGFRLAGNDPIVGIKRDKLTLNMFRLESSIAQKAMTHHWLKVARDLRTAS